MQVVSENHKTYFLNIGDIAVLSGQGKAITNLGSCVSICLYSKAYRVSVICHAQLPQRYKNSGTCYDTCPDACLKGRSCEMSNRFIDTVIPHMIHLLEKKGIKRSLMYAFVIGGGAVVPVLQKTFTVGDRNAATAEVLLKQNGIEIAFSDTGGEKSRKLEVHNCSGLVLINKEAVFRMW